MSGEKIMKHVITSFLVREDGAENTTWLDGDRPLHAYDSIAEIFARVCFVDEDNAVIAEARKGKAEEAVRKRFGQDIKIDNVEDVNHQSFYSEEASYARRKNCRQQETA